jgi:hypothetical protein
MYMLYTIFLTTAYLSNLLHHAFKIQDSHNGTSLTKL